MIIRAAAWLIGVPLVTLGMYLLVVRVAEWWIVVSALGSN